VSSEVQIANFLYRYAEYIDTGDFAGAASLFKHARIKLAVVGLVNADELLDIWKRLIILYPDGTPRTKHVMTNPIIEVNEAEGKATMRSYYTVFQVVSGTLQPIVAGRYHDEFERVEGSWQCTYRDYSLLDLVGDTSQHVRALTP
jgi:3-phenylpropionate/cinnamic acid dioxygenase small subunit